MASRQIYHMDIISDTGAVRCIIVISENTQFRQLSNRHLHDIRHEIVRNSVRTLPEQAALVSPDGIEIAQKDHTPYRIRLLDITQDLLQHRLGPTIGIRTTSLRALLRDGNLSGITVYGCRGTEDDALAIILIHQLAQIHRPRNIILIIQERFLHRFSYRLQSGKMDHGIKRVFRKHRTHTLFVAQIRSVKKRAGAGDLLDPIQHLLFRIE